MSRKEAKMLQIKLMLNWSGEIQHYCPNYFSVPLQLFYKILDQLFWVGIADMHRLSFKHVTNAHWTGYTSSFVHDWSCCFLSLFLVVWFYILDECIWVATYLLSWKFFSYIYFRVFPLPFLDPLENINNTYDCGSSGIETQSLWLGHNHQHVPPVGLIAQLIGHCTSTTEVVGSNPVQAWILFRP